ncbi:helix-turn-helix domain-containing protein [Planktotalea sp.]|uniref:helix-turn-helix domain-containing protein n=1 Tax=Planktotalea sp. TaxID=2029877 RepID=UPI003D6B10A4
MKSHANGLPVRELFGRNLRILSDTYPSVSEVCRQLDINRAQFNRYLNGESYPRPDTLAKICEFFGTDARILTEPLEAISQTRPDLLTHPEIREFTALETSAVSEEMLPSGFYRFSRQSFLYPESFVMGLLFVYRRDGWTFVKGSEARQSVTEQGLPANVRTRQFRGYALQWEDGIGAMVSRRNALTCTFNFIAPVASLNRNFWHGYAARTVNETINTTRVARMVYEYLGDSTSLILQTARGSGFCELDELPAFHRRLLRVGESFS